MILNICNRWFFWVSRSSWCIHLTKDTINIIELTMNREGLEAVEEVEAEERMDKMEVQQVA